MRRYTEILAVLALSAGMALHAQTNEMVIQTRKLGAEIQPTMYGLFFEDINYAADGGLYAELVKNRSFEFPQPLMAALLNAILIMYAFPTRDMGINIPDLTTKVSSVSASKKERSIVSPSGHDCHREVRKQHYVLNWSIPNQWASTRLLPHRVLRLIQKNGKNIR